MGSVLVHFKLFQLGRVFRREMILAFDKIMDEGLNNIYCVRETGKYI